MNKTIFQIKGHFGLILFMAIVFTGSCSSVRLIPTEAVNKLGESPYYALNEIPIQKDELNGINPEDVAYLITYYNREATRKFGQQAKDGAVLIFTKLYAIQKYKNLFSNYSKEYESIIQQTENDDIQYILNDQILTTNFEGRLAVLNESLLKSVEIINISELINKYQVDNKRVGVIIKAKQPKNTYKSKYKY
ncbi:MAG: hypothetical protein KAR19_03955 [Bacteroidales bacterium]|nr:hypothetical protein [Bacteroidales bacterium]